MIAVCKLACHYSLFTSKISTCKVTDFFANSQEVAAECDFRLSIFNFHKRCSIHSESLQQVKDAFIAVASEKYRIVKDILNLEITNPEPLLRLLTLSDIKGAQYDSSLIDPTDKVAFVVGSFIKAEKIAEACKYYIDVLNDDDITEAKSYVQSVYEIITFANQSAFEKIALKLVELKHMGNKNQAIVDFMKYAICDKATAEKVVEFL